MGKSNERDKNLKIGGKGDGGAAGYLNPNPVCRATWACPRMGLSRAWLAWCGAYLRHAAAQTGSGSKGEIFVCPIQPRLW